MAILSNLKRQRYLLDYTLASMGRRKVKNAVLLGIFFIIVFVLASVMLFGNAIRKEAAFVLRSSPEATVQSMVMGRHDLISGDVVDQLTKIRGLRSVEGRLWGYFFDRGNGANYTIMVPPKRSTEHQLEPGEIIVGSGIDRTLKSRSKTLLFLSGPDGRLSKFVVKEQLSTDSALMSADLVLMHESDYRAFFNLPENVFTDIALTIRNKKEINKILEKARRILPGARFITRASIERTYESIFSWREGLLLALLSTSILAFAILAFDKASGLSADERREIGILKAVGWETSDIIAAKFWEGGFVSVLAFLFGLLCAYAHVFFFQASLLEPVLKGWAVLYPDFSLQPTIDGLQVITLAGLTILPYTAATIVPIWRAAITDPDQVMR